MNHIINVALATEYGMAEAALIQNFQFWLAKNRANGKHFYDGHTWTYNSMRAFAELFPYLTKRQIERVLTGLRDKGVLLTGNYNTNPYDHTLWYAFADENRFLGAETDTRENVQRDTPPVASSINPDINTSTSPVDDAVTEKPIPPTLAEVLAHCHDPHVGISPTYGEWWFKEMCRAGWTDGKGGTINGWQRYMKASWDKIEPGWRDRIAQQQAREELIALQSLPTTPPPTGRTRQAQEDYDRGLAMAIERAKNDKKFHTLTVGNS